MDIGAIGDSFDYYYIIQCPLDKQVEVEEILGINSVLFDDVTKLEENKEEFIPFTIKGVEEYYELEE